MNWLLHLGLLHHTPLSPALTSLTGRGTFSASTLWPCCGGRSCLPLGRCQQQSTAGQPHCLSAIVAPMGKIRCEIAASHPPQQGLGSSARRDAAGCRDHHCFLYNGVKQSWWLSAWGKSQKPGWHGDCSIYAHVYMVFAYFFQFRGLSIFDETNYTTN